MKECHVKKSAGEMEKKRLNRLSRDLRLVRGGRAAGLLRWKLRIRPQNRVRASHSSPRLLIDERQIGDGDSRGKQVAGAESLTEREAALSDTSTVLEGTGNGDDRAHGADLGQETAPVVRLAELFKRKREQLSKKAHEAEADVNVAAWVAAQRAAQGVGGAIKAESDGGDPSGHAGERHVSLSPEPSRRRGSPPKQGSCVAVDCEMVGTFRNRSMLARVALVDEDNNVLMDEYVRPTERIINYRTKYSGIRPKDLVGAPDFQDVRQRVAIIIRGKILVGHAIHHDLEVLQLSHPAALVRDTSQYIPLRKELANVLEGYDCSQPPGLKRLSQNLLGSRIQVGEHCPVEDARHTMLLYCRHRKDWEQSLLC